MVAVSHRTHPVVPLPSGSSPNMFSVERIQGIKTKAKTLALMPPCGQTWRTVSGSVVRFVSSQRCGEMQPPTPTPAAAGLTSFCIFFEFCVLSLPLPLYPFHPTFSFLLSFRKLLLHSDSGAQVDLELWSSPLSLPRAGAAGLRHLACLLVMP